MEFLVNKPVEQIQYTDNSAARQLASRQGVGRVQHLSGKLLWVQDQVKDGQMILCQIPTLWNYGDIGTKSLKRSRMDFLLYGIGAINAETLEVIGE